MWHGVGATFVIWGLYHGLLLVAHRLLQDIRNAIPALKRIPLWLENSASWIITFALVTLGWILFRSNDWGQATRMLESLAHPGRTTALHEDFDFLVAIVAASYFSWLVLRTVVGTVREGSTLAQLEWLTRPLVLFTMILMIIIWSDQSSPFVYVKF
jgi:alginate O-acetyltransferase complex protein AlgI